MKKAFLVLSLVFIAMGCGSKKSGDAIETTPESISEFKDLSVGSWSKSCSKMKLFANAYSVVSILVFEETVTVNAQLWSNADCKPASNNEQPEKRSYEFSYVVKETPEKSIGRMELTQLPTDNHDQNGESFFLNLRVHHHGEKTQIAFLKGSKMTVNIGTQNLPKLVSLGDSMFVNGLFEINK